MAKQLMFDDEARKKVLLGIRQLAGAVKVTVGPSGRNVILEKKSGTPQATRDGVTVSKDVELQDPFENIGAKVVIHAADKTNDDAGDGTSTTVILAEAIYAAGLKVLAAGANPELIKNGIDRAVEAVNKEIKKTSRPVKGRKDYQHVAMVSSHYDPMLAKLVAWGPDRRASLSRMEQALRRFIVLGVTTNIPFMRRVLELPPVREGRYDTALLEEHIEALRPHWTDDTDMVAQALAAWAFSKRVSSDVPMRGSNALRDSASPWRQAGPWRMS